MNKTEDFLQHWGIKGMKWDNTKKSLQFDDALSRQYAAEEALAKSNDLTRVTKIGSKGEDVGTLGYIDSKGKMYKGDLKEILVAKKAAAAVEAGAKKKAALAKQQAASKPKPAPKPLTMSQKVAHISSDVIKKGKAFLANLFNR